jgi:hypothetical protein
MSIKSKAQEKFLWAKHPAIAKKWEKLTPKDKPLPEHVKKASDLLSYTHETKPGHIVKVATSMENPDATIDSMLDPSWNQKDNPYMDQPGGFAKLRSDGGPHTTFANKIKKDLAGGAITGLGASIASAPLRHLINPKVFSGGRKALIKHLALGTASGTAAGLLFAAADEARGHITKKAEGEANDSALKRTAKGALWESIAGAGGAAIEAPISKYVFKEKVHLGGGNLIKRMGAGAAIGAIMGAGGGALGVYGGKKSEAQINAEHDRVKNLLNKSANDVCNTSDGMDWLGSDKNPAEGMVALNHVASKKPTYPIVSDGDGLSDKINKSNTPGGRTSI